MSLAEDVELHVAAGFSGIWVVTDEQDPAEEEISKLTKDKDWRLLGWDADRGLSIDGRLNSDGPDVVSAVHALLVSKPDTEDHRTLLVVRNLHHFLGADQPAIRQAVANAIYEGKAEGCSLIVLSPSLDIPTELRRLFVVLHHALPTGDELLEVAKGVEGVELPTGDDLIRLKEAAAGLTRYEAEGAFALSMIEHEKLVPASVFEIKAQSLEKDGLLKLIRGKKTFADLGGMQNLKQFCTQVLRPRENRVGLAKGVLLTGIAGTGKSAFAEALGNETGRPVLSLNLSSMFSKYIGDSESNLRRALASADAMAPCIMLVDEIEKGVAGAGGGAQDGGVTTRLFGELLKWMQEHESDCFVLGTSNDLEKLTSISGGAMARAERFDAIFYSDVPNREEKDLIWKIYRGMFKIPAEDANPKDVEWTGAEIRQCCRLADLRGISLEQSSRSIVPISAVAAEQIGRMRAWASKNAQSVSYDGTFSVNGQPNASAPTRRVGKSPAKGAV
jgi:hypothetical protein